MSGAPFWGALPSKAELVDVFQGAFETWAELRRGTNAYRLVDVETGPLPGVTVEVFADFATLCLYEERHRARAGDLAEALGQLVRGVYLKHHRRADLRRLSVEEIAPTRPIAGEAAPAEIEVHEAEQRCLVRLAEGLSTGLFLDQRDNRAVLRAGSRGKSVLNLFSYTGAFSVAAALGDAERTLSIDVSARALERCRRNFDLYGLDPARHRLLKADAVKWLARAGRRDERFDWIVLDPPSFASVGHNVFSVERDYPRVVRDAVALLAPGGRLLAVTNHRRTSGDDLTVLVERAARATAREVADLDLLPAPADCGGVLGRAKSVLLKVAS